VWDALDAAGPQGLTKYGIMKETGLTEGQVTYAFGFIKDVLMEKYSQPLVCNATTYRYSLPPEWYEVKEYVDFRVLGILAMVRRIEHITNASQMKWGKTDPIRTASKHVTRSGRTWRSWPASSFFASATNARRLLCVLPRCAPQPSFSRREPCRPSTLHGDRERPPQGPSHRQDQRATHPRSLRLRAALQARSRPLGAYVSGQAYMGRLPVTTGS